jgi:subtilisin family serine protease
VGGRAGTANADIHATSAWGVATGSRANVVAVVDTGVDYTHSDLAANIWSAPIAFTVTVGGATIACAAGTHGFNAIAKSCDPRDDNNHGTHVSGTIGSVGNNALGVTGVNWTASMMGAKFLDSTGSGTTADAINAIEFTIQAKNAFASTAGANVRVLSNSWGGSGFSQALLDEINKANANGMLFVAAAGNSSSNNDLAMTYPASYQASNVLAIAATDNTDQLASFSNFGSSVQLAAPGVNILSTTIGNTYQYFSGTSMATPHVSGAAALILSKCALDTVALKTTLINNVDVIPALAGWVGTSGRLNVDKALRSCASAPTAPTGFRVTSR